jgi:hypothetical protein
MNPNPECSRGPAADQAPLSFAAFGDELDREGCGHLSFLQFWTDYFAPQGIGRTDDVTRIEWRYLPNQEDR